MRGQPPYRGRRWRGAASIPPRFHLVSAAAFRRADSYLWVVRASLHTGVVALPPSPTPVRFGLAIHTCREDSNVTAFEIDSQDFLLFIDRALDGMVAILEGLGDELANKVPDLPGANSPYAILFHCLGVTNYWIGTLLGGRDVPRDRSAEFKATGTVKDLSERIQGLKLQIRNDLDRFAGTTAITSTPNRSPIPEHDQWTQGRVLVHTYEELAQHHGQMELTRDILNWHK